MTLILAPGTTAPTRTRLTAFLGALLVLAAMLALPPASASAATDDGALVVTLAPDANGILSPGQSFSATVLVDNGTDAAVAGGPVTLAVGDAPLPDREALAAWLSGDAPTPPGAQLGTSTLAPLGAGESGSTGVIVPPDHPALAARGAGVYPLEAVVAVPDATVSARSALVVPAAGTTPIGVVVPITAGAGSDGLLASADLAALTAPDGALTALLSAVAGTSAILAVDPAVPAAIRALGTAAPATALAWLDRLDTLPNSRFALQFGDADVSTQLATGLAAPLQPTSLQAYLSPSNFATTPGGGGASPDPSPSPRSASSLPTLDELVDVGATRANVYWPPTGSADASVVTTLGGLGTPDAPALTLVPSATTSAGPDAAASPRGDIGGTGVLVYDSAVSAALTSAADDATPARGASLTAATAFAALSAAAGSPLLAVVDRTAATARPGLRAAVLAATGAPGTAPVGLGALASAAPAPVSMTGGAPDGARAAAAGDVLAGSDRIARFATILDDPALLEGPERATALQLLGAGWIGTGTRWDAALAAHRDDVTATVSSVSIVPPTPVNVLSADTGLRVWLRNDLSYPVTVVLHAEPDDLRLDVQRSTTAHIAASSNSPVEVPVEARVGSGEVAVDLALSGATGEPIGTHQTASVTVRADWEGIGIVVLAALVAVLLVLGVARTIVHRRRVRAAASAPGAATGGDA